MSAGKGLRERRISLARQGISGILSQIRTKLLDWAVRQARAGCYSWAVLSSNDSKTLYNIVGNLSKYVSVHKIVCTYLTLSPVSSAPFGMTGWLQTMGLHVGSTSAVSSEYHTPYLKEEIGFK